MIGSIQFRAGYDTISVSSYIDLDGMIVVEMAIKQFNEDEWIVLYSVRVPNKLKI
jgi:hypothetical protein